MFIFRRIIAIIFLAYGTSSMGLGWCIFNIYFPLMVDDEKVGVALKGIVIGGAFCVFGGVATIAGLVFNYWRTRKIAASKVASFDCLQANTGLLNSNLAGIIMVALNPLACFFLSLSLIIVTRKIFLDTASIGTFFLIVTGIGTILMCRGAWILLPTASHHVTEKTFFDACEGKMIMGERCAYVTMTLSVISIIMPVFASIPAMVFGITSLVYLHNTKKQIKISVWLCILFSALTAVVVPVIVWLYYILLMLH